MNSSFPDLNWARLRVFTDGSADVFDCDGKLHQFTDEQEAKWFLLEDEFVSLENLDEDDEEDLGCSRKDLNPPAATNDEELKSLVYDRRSV